MLRAILGSPVAGQPLGPAYAKLGTMDVSTSSNNSGNMLHSNCFIKNLPSNCTEQTLLALFQPHGKVTSIRIFSSGQPSRSPFAFVKMSSPYEAQAAIAALNNAQLGSHILEVKLADSDLGTQPQSTPPAGDNLYVIHGFIAP